MLTLDKESFQLGGQNLPISLIDFWQWAHSDLLSNTLRGVLAEFIVATALNLNQTPRLEWNAYDLVTQKGLRLEVKSSAYLQSWQQAKESAIRFSISETKGWESSANTSSTVAKRQADVYIFCLFGHKDKTTANPLNLDQWAFFVLPTDILNAHVPRQKSISLSGLLKLNPAKCSYAELSCLIQEFENRLIG